QVTPKVVEANTELSSILEFIRSKGSLYGPCIVVRKLQRQKRTILRVDVRIPVGCHTICGATEHLLQVRHCLLRQPQKFFGLLKLRTIGDFHTDSPVNGVISTVE